MKKVAITATGLILAALLLSFCKPVVRMFMSPGEPPAGQKGMTTETPGIHVQVVAEGLEIPWEIRFLPDGDMLVTERPGRLLKLPIPDPDDAPVHPEDGHAWTVASIHHQGEGGLMGLALHPNFAANRLIYLMHTSQKAGQAVNRVTRYRLTELGLIDAKTILDNIPAASFHTGGRLAFGPDGYLYITTGDATQSELAQTRNTLNGKILRVTDNGEIPPDNPFDSLLWSWGHRNPQGLAWDDSGRLWSTEHGRSGLRSGFDELNLIQPGANYGWPAIEGDATESGMHPPVKHSGPDYTWAPADLAWLDKRLFFGGLRGQALYATRIQGEKVAGFHAHFVEEFGRIRAVAVGPDSMLYFATSNRDGRGRVHTGDDKILRVDPADL
ncbi:PQQ-dependent sugar dehydrogenase [Methylohalobius crimeensis]|uniref:PQQ-dependent sugar dehydrogenase n=1 Tax=Methylohalobius crimeensis TaxID=244365 RepID=UPI0003B7A7CC|nr:PQQ-dependent sugar dehydrogenase [Methylohalobius crimeensis]